MNEVEKMFENAGIEKCNSMLKYIMPSVCLKNNEGENYKCEDCEYNWFPNFNAEKQIEILEYCLKWGQVHIIGGIDDREYRIETSYYRQNYQSTLADAIANYINEKWDKLAIEERMQIKEILE